MRALSIVCCILPLVACGSVYHGKLAYLETHRSAQSADSKPTVETTLCGSRNRAPTLTELLEQIKEKSGSNIVHDFVWSYNLTCSTLRGSQKSKGGQ